MKTTIRHIDVLDVEADALIYSTNVMLNCTGGVGACLLKRYGASVQFELHELLRQKGSTFAERGDVFEHKLTRTPYTTIFHTIPSDPVYKTSAETVDGVLSWCLERCVESADISEVALSALATGYGNLLFDEFFRVAARVLHREAYESLAKVAIAIDDYYSFQLAMDQSRDEALRFEIE